MDVVCKECGSTTSWDEDVGSAVCTSCGSLADPSQSVLTSSLYGSHNDTAEPSLWDPSAATTLKNLRSGNNWDLAGQGKESRDRKNAYAISEFIKSLAVSLNAAGLSPRATTLFNQAKLATNFRWGQRSRSIAAACLAISLRESNRPDSFRDIASILDVPPTSVIRDFTSITSALRLSLTIVDPSVHIPTLLEHLNTISKLSPAESGLSPNLRTILGSLSLREVAKTATSLSQMIIRLSPDHEILHLPLPPTTCGIFILAMEAELRAPLNPLGDVAQCLGSRCHASKSTVMARYKTLQDEIASWAEQLPWLGKYESRNGRAKVSKRIMVCRGLKDVIHFHEDIWRQKTMPTLDLDLENDDEEANEIHDIQPSSVPQHPFKRPKLSRDVTQATQFLLNPLDTSISFSRQSKKPSAIPRHLSVATYVLSNAPNNGQSPTRLQLLSHTRGGVDEEHIPDEELFVEGEFENLLRNEDEIRLMRQMFNVEESEIEHFTTRKQSRSNKKRVSPDVDDEIIGGSVLRSRRKSRIDIEALAKLMDNDRNNDSETSEGPVPIGMMGISQAILDSDDEDLGLDLYDNDTSPKGGCRSFLQFQSDNEE